MPSSPISRRQLLGASLKVGAGAAVLGLSGTGGEAWASALRQRSAAGLTTTPPPPPMVQSFVSRPDLTPPGVSIVQSTDVAAIPNQPQYIFLTPTVASGLAQPTTTVGLMITDLAGNLVWWKPMPSTTARARDFRVQTYQGAPVLTWWEGTVADAFGQFGTAVITDTDYNTFDTVSTDLYQGIDLHEFLITPQDTALCTSYEFSGDYVYGHALELAIPNSGSTTPIFDWSSQNNVPPSLSYLDKPDYFHINSIDLWPGSARNLLISSRNTWSVYLIDRQTKDIIWRIGGRDSSFAMGEGTLFEYQHDARPLSDGSGISLFDDAAGAGTPEKRSWGKVFTVDQGTKEVTLRHEFDHPNATIDSGSQGNNQLLATGGHFVGWGATPWFTLFGPSGSAVVPPAILDGRLPSLMGNYRAYMDDWTATPSPAEMALIVKTAAGTGNFTAYMSWNGATEIASWRINAGTSTNPVDLPTIKRQQKTGFETVIPFTRDGATEFQAVALDVNGEVLGRTAIVQVS